MGNNYVHYDDFLDYFLIFDLKKQGFSARVLFMMF